MRAMRATVVALSAVLACATPTMAVATPDGDTITQPERHRAVIGGRVVTPDRMPVEGATVQLLNEDGRVIRRATSNERGFFRFRPVPHGVYLVRAGHRDFGTDSQRVNTRHSRRVLLVLE